MYIANLSFTDLVSFDIVITACWSSQHSFLLFVSALCHALRIFILVDGIVIDLISQSYVWIGITTWSHSCVLPHYSSASHVSGATCTRCQAHMWDGVAIIPRSVGARLYLWHSADHACAWLLVCVWLCAWSSKYLYGFVFLWLMCCVGSRKAPWDAMPWSRRTSSWKHNTINEYHRTIRICMSLLSWCFEIAMSGAASGIDQKQRCQSQLYMCFIIAVLGCEYLWLGCKCVLADSSLCHDTY